MGQNIEIQHLIKEYFFQKQPILQFNLSKIQQNLEYFKEISAHHSIDFLMAVKALPERAILAELMPGISGVDVSNAQEYALLPEDMGDKIVWLTDPAGSCVEIPSLMRKGNELIVTIESLSQLLELETISIPIQYAVRINSALLLNQRTGSVTARGPLTWSRFGADPQNVELMERLTHSSKHQFVGFHIHHGSEQNSVATYLELGQAIRAMTDRLSLQLRVLNFGGGLHKISSEELEGMAQRIRSMWGRETLLFFEPGRALSENAGLAIGQIMLQKLQDDREINVLDLSAFCHLSWSNPELLLLKRPPQGSFNRKVTFFGPTCYENDIVGDYNFLCSGGPLFHRGDLVIFSNVSTYSLALNRGFNGVRPAILKFIYD